VHKNNPHSGRYDLQALIKANPAFAEYVHINQFGKETIDFHNPKAVKSLNQSLLKKHYAIDHWDIPEGYLCPPIPGRADYIHYISDLLINEKKKVARGSKVKILDIGVGSNCIYPLIGHQTFGWTFVGSDIDEVALDNAQKIIRDNGLEGAISLKHQPDPAKLLDGIMDKENNYDIVICNPPFHESADAAQKANRRKSKNLKNPKGKLNFGGQSTELWYEGGEIAFIAKLIVESRQYSRSAYWYTTLVSKESNLPQIKTLLNKEKPAEYKVIEMTQGNKVSRFVAWTFLPNKTRKIWETTRWI